MSSVCYASEPTSVSGSTISFTFTYDTQTSFNRWLEAGLFRAVSYEAIQVSSPTITITDDNTMIIDKNSKHNKLVESNLLTLHKPTNKEWRRIIDA